MTSDTTVRFLHTSDWQLGIRRWFLHTHDNADAQARFDAARLAAVRALGQLAIAQDCSFIVVSGDVFEHNSLERHTIGRALEVLRHLPVPVFLLPGNHDPLTADSIFYRTQDIDNVTVLTNTEPVAVDTPAGVVEIVGAPWLTKHATRDLVSDAIAPLEPTDRVRIVVGHGQVKNRSGEFAPELIDLSALERAVADRTIDYVALGDTHSAMALDSAGAVWFSGTPETTDFHERGLRGQHSRGENNSGVALTVAVTKQPHSPEPSRVEVHEHQVGTWTFDAVEWDVNDASDVEAFLAFLSAYPNKAETVVKYALQGSVDMSTMQQLDAGLADLAPVFGALYERQRLMDLSLAPSDEDLAQCELGGYAGHALAELSELAAQPPGTSRTPERDTAHDALRLLFRLAQKR